MLLFFQKSFGHVRCNSLILIFFCSHKRDEFVEVMYCITSGPFYSAELLRKKCIRATGQFLPKAEWHHKKRTLSSGDFIKIFLSSFYRQIILLCWSKNSAVMQSRMLVLVSQSLKVSRQQSWKPNTIFFDLLL